MNSKFINQKRVTYFLSRLCGGEEVVDFHAHPATFLSRLCGGEDCGVVGRLVFLFLSRLCGGEVV